MSSSALLVHRVATVLSLAQLPQQDDATKPSPVTISSLPGRSIPTYHYGIKSPSGISSSFKRSYDKLPDKSSVAICIIPHDADNQDHEKPDAAGPIESGSLLDTLIQSMWNDCLKDGLFRYSLDKVETKLIEGQSGWVSQLNVDRFNKKRVTEYTVDDVVQEFDGNKFNFSKAYGSEVLFAFEAPPISSEGDLCSTSKVQSVPCASSPNLVLINVSPIDYGHILLVPRALDLIPQLVDEPSMELAIRLVREVGNPYLRLAYNSLGAYASVNHLHFQGYYQRFELACEKASREPLNSIPTPSGGSILIGRLSNFPVNTFVLRVEMSDEGDESWISPLASAVTNACLVMQRTNQPHNLIITERGRQIFLFPNQYATMLAEGKVPPRLLDTGVNPAVFEMSGHQLFKRREDYDEMDEGLINELISLASLPLESFIDLGHKCGLVQK